MYLKRVPYSLIRPNWLNLKCLRLYSFCTSMEMTQEVKQAETDSNKLTKITEGQASMLYNIDETVFYNKVQVPNELLISYSFLYAHLCTNTISC